MADMRLTDEQLVAYAAGELAAADRAEVERALTALPAASADARRLAHVIETLRADDSRSPSPEALQRALAVFQTREPSSSGTSWIEQATRLVADLVFDGRGQAAVAGFRSAATADQSMLGFDTELGRLDLQLRRTDDERWELRGELLLEDEAVLGAVALVPTGEVSSVADATVDAMGQFRLECEPGAYDLLLQVDDGAMALVAPDLRIG